MQARSLYRPLLGVALGTALLLLVPAVAGWLTPEVNWGAEDFAAAAVLLFGAGCGLVFVARRVSGKAARAASFAAILTLLGIVWAELAVGLFH
jgi:hypothetical protein